MKRMKRWMAVGIVHLATTLCLQAQTEQFVTVVKKDGSKQTYAMTDRTFRFSANSGRFFFGYHEVRSGGGSWVTLGDLKEIEHIRRGTFQFPENCSIANYEQRQSESSGENYMAGTARRLFIMNNESHEPVDHAGDTEWESSNENTATIARNNDGTIDVFFLKSGMVTITANDENLNEMMVTYVVRNQPMRTYTVNGVSFNMISVEGGTFNMGSETGDEREKPMHTVNLSDYYMGETEVTQQLWEAVMGNNPSDNQSNALLPVEMITWKDCQEFISKLNKLTGETFRLPTEAEWEYAARGGRKNNNYTYSGSNSLDEVGWYVVNSTETTHEVGSKQPNELGIYDMSGNVWEWCADRYGSYTEEAQTNPTGPPSGIFRVMRGGSFRNDAGNCRNTYRNYYTPASCFTNCGLRLAL